MSSLDQRWLAEQCKSIEGASHALLMLRQAEGDKLKVAAHWSDNGKQQVAELIPISNSVLLQKKSVTNTNVKGNKESSGTFDYLAIPLSLEKKLCGIFTLKLSPKNEQERTELIGRIHQNAKYILLAHEASSSPSLNAETDVQISEKSTQRDNPERPHPEQPQPEINKPEPDADTKYDFYTDVVKLGSAALEHKTYESSSRVMISELASTLECERVSIGIFKHQHIRVTAISGSANFDPRSNMVRAIADSMEEAIDQDTVISFAKGQKSGNFIDKAHFVLADQHGANAICTFPLTYDGTIYGAVVLERTSKDIFSSNSILMCEQFCTLIGPYLALMIANESSLLAKINKSAKAAASGFFDLHNLRFKVLASICTFLIAYICIAEGDIQVTSSAFVEGKIQRVVAAPMDGFIVSSSFRAGDMVKKGDVIAILDDKDLELERLKLSSQREKVQREYREAMASYNKSQVRILSAQADQIQADISLVDEQLARTQIIAPFDGIIIDGDLTQSLASPVSRGELLYKIAPLDGYRIILKVDEKNILQIKDGQKGLLALASLPGEKMPMIIEKITPVAQTENGRNTFRVEASLEKKQALMRPGMQGVARVDTGKATYIWLWTHELIDWVRLWFWSWRP